VHQSGSIPSALPPPERLEAYDTGADRYTARRFRMFVTNVMLPLLLFCCGGYYLVMIRPGEQQAVAAKAKALVTPTATARVVSGDQVIGGRVVVATPTPEGKAAQVVPTVGIRLRCYARVDARGVYSDVVLPAESLVYADAFTRANQGMIWNRNLGWFSLRDVVCAPGLEHIEVEFIPPPRSPTPTVTRVVPTRTRTPVPSPTAIPSTPTPLPGILVFEYFDCHQVKWHVWGATGVYLTVGTARRGVAGDNHGAPVVQDLCEYLGSRVRLDVFLRDGSHVYREGLLQ